MTAWIKMIPENEATGVLKKLYDEAMTPHGNVWAEHRGVTLSLKGDPLRTHSS